MYSTISVARYKVLYFEQIDSRNFIQLCFVYHIVVFCIFAVNIFVLKKNCVNQRSIVHKYNDKCIRRRALSNVNRAINFTFNFKLYRNCFL